MREGVRQLIGTLCLALALAAGGCDESVTGPSLNEEFTVAPGEIASVADADIRVRFDGVEGDSRCPADATCIQGGDAIVRVSVLSGSVSTPYELHTGSMAPVQHRRLTISLVDLQPYPFSSRTIEPGDYRATLRVTR